MRHGRNMKLHLFRFIQEKGVFVWPHPSHVSLLPKLSAETKIVAVISWEAIRKRRIAADAPHRVDVRAALKRMRFRRWRVSGTSGAGNTDAASAETGDSIDATTSARPATKALLQEPLEIVPSSASASATVFEIVPYFRTFRCRRSRRCSVSSVSTINS